MPNEFRHVQCPGCFIKLRLVISEKNYGKKIEITCPECKTKCRTTIPRSAVAQEKRRVSSNFFDLNNLSDAIRDALK